MINNRRYIKTLLTAITALPLLIGCPSSENPPTTDSTASPKDGELTTKEPSNINSQINEEKERLQGENQTVQILNEDASFSEATNFTVGKEPRSVAVGEFSGDGILDLAVGNRSSNDISVLLGNGDGSFGIATNFAAGERPNSVAVGDFNGDGISDLAVANSYSNDISVLLGKGDGSFGIATNFAAGERPNSVAIGDFNGDGISDLTAITSSEKVSVLLGNGNGNFSDVTQFDAERRDLKSAAVGDFNSDGILDLAVAAGESYGGSGNALILLGNGRDGFRNAARFDVGDAPNSLVAGEFNGDGLLDLAVANKDSGNISVLLGKGGGSLSKPTNFGTDSTSVNSSPYSIAIGDFNNDDISDLAVTNFSLRNVSVLLGNGNGSFKKPRSFDVEGSLASVAIGDFNGDGLSDLAVANGGSINGVSILLNTASVINTP